MYTVYCDLAADTESVGKMQALQTARDRTLYKVFQKKNIPPFPMDKTIFEKHRPVFEEISKKNMLLCFLFEYQDTCVVLNKGSYREYDSVIDAQHAVYNVKDGSKIMHVVNKYTVN